MNANVSKLINEQINKEFYSAYLVYFLYLRGSLCAGGGRDPA